MIEFALILPILVLLLVLAIDFGRVFFQWVGVSNASRIGANYAARHPEAWDSTPDTVAQDEYRTLVARDLNPLNCLALDLSEVGPTDIPDPAYGGFEVGDQVEVTLQCRFQVLTPVAAAFVGNLFTVSADSTFTVNGGRIDGIPVGVVPPESGSGGGGTPCAQATVPDLVNKTVAEAELTWTSRFTGAFTAPGGAQPDDVVVTQVTTPSANVGDCVAVTTSVVVTVATPTACAAGEGRVPSLVDMTVGAARDAWTDAGFTGAFLPIAAPDDDVVTSQSVSSGDGPGDCAPLSSLVVVGSGPVTDYCTAELLTGLTKAAAQAKYTGAGFTGNFKATGNQSGTVSGQKLTAGQAVPCSSDEDVKLTK